MSKLHCWDSENWFRKIIQNFILPTYQPNASLFLARETKIQVNVALTAHVFDIANGRGCSKETHRELLSKTKVSCINRSFSNACHFTCSADDALSFELCAMRVVKCLTQDWLIVLW